VIGWNLLCDVACTLLPVFACWPGEVPPVAPVTADCRCKVCDCKEKCECKGAPACQPTAPATAPAARYCPGQHGCRPMPMSAPAAAPAPGETVYRVQVKLAGDAAGTDSGMCYPAVSMPANTYSLVSVASAEGKAPTALHVQVKPVDDGTVRLNLKLGMPGKAGEAVKRLACTSEVRLDTVTGVVLEGDGPEPCPAEVCVSASKEVPVSPVIIPRPAVCPVPFVVPPPPVGGAMPVPPPIPCVLPNAPMTLPVPTLPPRAAEVRVPAPVAPPMMPEPMPAPATAVSPVTGTTAVMPEPLPTPTVIPPPAPVPAVRLVTANRASPSAVSLAHTKGGKAELCWKHADGSVSHCVRMKREAGESGVLTFAAGKQHVHVHGRTWTAVADKVDVHDDGFLVMSGHVKVVCEKGETKSTLSADRVAMKVRKGQIDKVLGGMVLPR